MRPSVPDVHITDPHDADLAAYRALAPQAVAGLIFGLLAPLAMVDPLLWALPALGTIFSVWGTAPHSQPQGRIDWPQAGLARPGPFAFIPRPRTRRSAGLPLDDP